MQGPDPERECTESQAEDRRAEWQRPELRRIEAGSAENFINFSTDGIFPS
jgi:hypothetical protein